MAERMGIRELRDTLTKTIRRVEAGATIEITHHGRPVATLTPAGEDRVERLMRAGDISPPEHRGLKWPQFPITTGLSASQALEEDRSER